MVYGVQVGNRDLRVQPQDICARVPPDGAALIPHQLAGWHPANGPAAPADDKCQQIKN